MTPLGLLLLLAAWPLAAEEEAAVVRLKAQQATAAEQQRRLEIYLEKAPHPVADALATLAGGVAISFRCPAAPLGKDDGVLNGGKRELPAQNVKIKVVTEVAAWNAEEAQDGDRAGYYQWNFRGVGWDADGTRAPLTVRNKLMLNPDGVSARSLYDHVQNVLTYYHELLHGQLLLEAMQSDREWQALYCKLDMTPKETTAFFAPLDPEHRRIGPLERKFEAWLWEEVQRRADAEDDDPWRAYPKKAE